MLQGDHRPVGQRHLGVLVGVVVDGLDHHAALVQRLAGDRQPVHHDRQVGVLVQRAGHELAEGLAAQILRRDPLGHVVGELGGRRHLQHQQVLGPQQAGQPLDQLQVVLEVGHGVAQQAPQDRLVADQPVPQPLQLVEVLLVGEVELHRQGLAAERLDEGQVPDGLQADPQHLRAHVHRDVQHLRVGRLQGLQHRPVLLAGAGAEADVVELGAGQSGLQVVPPLGEGVDAVLHHRVVGVAGRVLPGDGRLDAPVGVAGDDLLLVAAGGVGPLEVVGQVGQLARLVLPDHQQRPAELGLLHDPLEPQHQLHPFHHVDSVEMRPVPPASGGKRSKVVSPGAEWVPAREEVRRPRRSQRWVSTT